MTGADRASSGARLGLRTWVAAAVLPVSAGATILGAACSGALAEGPARAVVLLAVPAAGAVGGVLWARVGGTGRTHRRVASARAAWARTWSGARLEHDGSADPGDAELALPRGWRVELARGRLRLEVGGAPVRCETWVLRAAPGSRRSRVRREVVATDARTGPVRVHVPVGSSADSLLVTPAWVRRGHQDDPVWLPAVRERVARHRDVLGSLSVGDGRVVLLALDDPRPGTALARAELVRDVAVLVR